ncbi:MAG: glycoside hydrolase family 9 protein, partial [Prolixibacteraceae bacterium]|nr:glycoside hydrolase family 9 protein [Prolixibacteraceae bacterium]
MKRKFIYLLVLPVWLFVACTSVDQEAFVLNDKGYFEKQGVNVLVFTNWYNGLFGDEKMSGIEIIQHEVRIVTNGDVRIDPTPEQWDAIPKFVERNIDSISQVVEAKLTYTDYQFHYTIRSEADGDAMLISVHLDEPVPEKLAGKAGFNMEFLPAEYFEKSYLADGKPGSFPLYPSGPMTINNKGNTEALPLAAGKNFVLAPEDPLRMVSIESDAEIMLYDGRNKAQNGWYVLRTLIPAGKTGQVITWKISVNAIPGWKREPMIAYSQLGYHPNQAKMAMVEFDKTDRVQQKITLNRVEANGILTPVKTATLEDQGSYLRYLYGKFDFSEVTAPGVYSLQLGQQQTKTFRIDESVYETAWQPALDVYMPVQMDHMLVNEAYRVWHGKSHMDDALQAPVNHVHFDLYAQGPTTDTPYKPGQHIPGLNVGGWYDAGDFDIRTQSQYQTIITLVHAREDFGIDRDETLVDQL